MNFNQVILMGRLTRDPELRYTPKGSPIATLGLAINRKTKMEGGEQKEEVTFVDVTAFGKQAETLSQYLKRGSPIHLVGRLRTESWDDKTTGQKRSKLVVVLESFQFLGKQTDEAAPARDKQAQAELGTAPKDEPAAEGDDVPF